MTGRRGHGRAGNPSPSPTPEPHPEHAWEALRHVNGWIAHMDAKAGAALAGAGVVGGVLYNIVDHHQAPSRAFTIASVITAILAGVAAVMAALTLVPRLKATSGAAAGPGSSLLYFATIAADYSRNAANPFAADFAALTTDPARLTGAIGEQIHSNAHVAARKSVWVARAIWAVTSSLVMLGVLGVINAQHW